MSFFLLPKEKLVNSYACKHKRNLNGTMHISNIRVWWVPDSNVADKISEVDIPMSEIDIHKDVQSVDQDKRSVLLIKTQDSSKTFSFSDANFQRTVKAVVKDLNIAKKEFEEIGMDSEEKYKLTKLMENDYLKQLFKDLVETGKITDEEFWGTMTDIKQFNRKEVESKMEGGVSNKRLVISNKYILDSNSAEINLEKADAIRLLNEYPKLKELYELKVNDDENEEKEFWEYYLKKNYDYRTEIFGGENPIYTGSNERDEKTYEDKYINKDIFMVNEDSDDEKDRELARKLRKIDPSINVIFNKDDELKPEGYGNYQPTITAEIGMDDQQIKGIKHLKALEKEEEDNQKLLWKYNAYSERILSKNADDKIAVSDIQRYKSNKGPHDVDMKTEGSKMRSALNPDKHKSISKEQIQKNLSKIQKFSLTISEFKSKPLHLGSWFPNESETKNYLENITSKAYKTTLRVKSEDIEKRIPENILAQQHFYQQKHDKLLQLFYQKFPISNPSDLEKVLGMKDTIMRLGKEISDLMKKMNKDQEYKKYTSIYEPMKTTLITVLHKIKDLKPDE